jgi:hypothetical protein
MGFGLRESLKQDITNERNLETGLEITKSDPADIDTVKNDLTPPHSTEGKNIIKMFQDNSIHLLPEKLINFDSFSVKNEFELSEDDKSFVSVMPRSPSPSLSFPQHRLFSHHSSSPQIFLCEVLF